MDKDVREEQRERDRKKGDPVGGKERSPEKFKKVRDEKMRRRTQDCCRGMRRWARSGFDPVASHGN